MRNTGFSFFKTVSLADGSEFNDFVSGGPEKVGGIVIYWARHWVKIVPRSINNLDQGK